MSVVLTVSTPPTVPSNALMPPTACTRCCALTTRPWSVALPRPTSAYVSRLLCSRRLLHTSHPTLHPLMCRKSRRRWRRST